MLVSPNKRIFGQTIRILVVIFSLGVLYEATSKPDKVGGLVAYLALLIILMLFGQDAIAYSLTDGKAGVDGSNVTISPLDVLFVYFLAISTIFARSLEDIPVPDAIYFVADAVALLLAAVGLVLRNRRRASKKDD